jgi:hypothetical protein
LKFWLIWVKWENSIGNVRSTSVMKKRRHMISCHRARVFVSITYSVFWSC